MAKQPDLFDTEERQMAQNNDDDNTNRVVIDPVVDIPPSNLREVITRYIQGRLQDKLDKLKPEENEKREELRQKYAVETWLDVASLRANQIKLATHTGKQQHPDSKATPVYAGDKIPHGQHHQLLGSQDIQLVEDVAGGAAALDIFKMLRLSFEGETLLSRLLRHDRAFKQALALDADIAEIRFARFLAFAQMPSQLNAGRTAKQLYFPVDQNNDLAQKYHVLILLYPSSLVHCAWQQMQADRFGELQKSLRDLRRNEQYSEQEARDYPNTLIQSYGGTKPQNISQLNSDRGGKMTLLPSMPPVWRGQGVVLPKDSLFKGWYLSGRDSIQSILDALTKHYRNPYRENNMDFRDKLDALLEDLANEVIVAAFELQQNAPAGWTKSNNIDRNQAYWLDIGYRQALFAQETQGNLDSDQQDWLAAYRARDWHKSVGMDFANWVNKHISAVIGTKLDDHEGKVWAAFLTDLLNLLIDEELEDAV